VEGEKHLVFIAEKGLALGRSHGDSIAKMAASARVTISFIQVGGLPPGFLTGSSMFGRGLLLLHRVSDGELFRPEDHRALAEETGGSASFFQDADKALDRLNRSTRSVYLLGYYPSRPPSEGEHRQVRVTVARPGVTVLYRHAYQARPVLDDTDELRRILSDARIQAAGASSQSFPYIQMKLSASVLRTETNESDVHVNLVIDPLRVTFKRTEDSCTASLDVAVFVGDAGERARAAVGRIDLKLDAVACARGQRRDFAYHDRQSRRPACACQGGRLRLRCRPAGNGNASIAVVIRFPFPSPVPAKPEATSEVARWADFLRTRRPSKGNTKEVVRKSLTVITRRAYQQHLSCNPI
jgi:hypothetical protein